jgi:hypothetical protein
VRGSGRLLFLTSLVGLFVELALIRWIPNTVHVVAFFANLVLIAAFLGLGIGMARPAPLSQAAGVAAMRLGLLVAGLSLVGLIEPTTSFGSAADYAVNEGQGSGLALPLALVLLATFALVTWSMIPFGRAVGSHFDDLERIQAYSINIAGSLAGVILFSVLSWLGAPPLVWFGVVLLILATLRPGRVIVVVVPAVVLSLAAGWFFDSRRLTQEVVWSPYYKLRVIDLDPDRGRSAGFIVDVNNQFLLSALDLRPESVPPDTGNPALEADVSILKSYYDFPFNLREPGNVLVLGAGAGNDLAAALRGGAVSVTGVEIDPEVLRLGGQHPESPLASPRVRIVLQDARAFLRSAEQQYDLILFATLDAHGLISSMGSVRLDSFVYTLESLEAAKSRLASAGLLVLSFGPFREDIQFRQYAMGREVFGQDPLYFLHENNHRTIVAGAIDSIGPLDLADEWTRIDAAQIADGFARYPHAERLATDDWPHLYITDRNIPREYVAVLIGIVLLSLVLVRSSLRASYRMDIHFMFLGAGFLLLETKSVTEYALLVGSTWVTNSLVFTVILAAILIVNLAVSKGWMRLSVPVLFSALGLALVLQFLLPVSRWAGSGGLLTATVAGLYLGIPMVLASAIFASTFRTAVLGSAALASNLVGSVIGGVSEYSSLVVGLRALSLVALVMYGAAFVSWYRSRSKASTQRLEVPASSAVT